MIVGIIIAAIVCALLVAYFTYVYIQARKRYMTAMPHICDRSMWEQVDGTENYREGTMQYTCPRCSNTEYRESLKNMWVEHYSEPVNDKPGFWSNMKHYVDMQYKYTNKRTK